MCIFCERAQAQLAEGGGLTQAQKREVEDCERLKESRVRATILTGFLGSGKTTFLNFVLKSSHGKKMAVVQNEFGSVSVDDKLMLLEKSDTEMVVMPNGCLCCRVRGDLVDALRRLAAKHAQGSGEAPPLDGLLIECSGLSEVMPVAQTFFADPYVQAAYKLDGVVCMCDAASFAALEGGSAEGTGSAGTEVAQLLREQLALSDVALLNKCDLVSSQQRDALSSRIREVSPAIKVVPCRHGKVNLAQVLRIDSFSLDSALSLDAHFLAAAQPLPDEITQASAARNGDKLSLVNAFQGGNGGAGNIHAHSMFGTLGLQLPGSVNVEALKEWLRQVVEKHGDALVRLKGVLQVSDGSSHVIVQGVGGHIEVSEETPGAGTSNGGGSRLVFIGKLRDAALRRELHEGFQATAAVLPGADPANPG